MHMNEPQESPYRAIEQNPLLSSVNNHWSAFWLCRGLGIFFCLIGLVMACNPTVVEASRAARESFHKMLGAPGKPYSFVLAAVVLYMVAGAIMIALSFRTSTILRSISSFFGALMLSIVVVTALFGQLGGFILFQLLVGIAFVCYGYGAPKSARS